MPISPPPSRVSQFYNFFGSSNPSSMTFVSNISPFKRSASDGAQGNKWFQESVTSGLGIKKSKSVEKHMARITTLCTVKCQYVLAGNMKTVSQEVHFNNDGLWFKCPDNFFEKLYVVILRYEYMDMVTHFFGPDLKVIFIFPKFVFKSHVSHFLCLSHSIPGCVCPTSCPSCLRLRDANNSVLSDFQQLVLVIGHEVDISHLKNVIAFFKLPKTLANLDAQNQLSKLKPKHEASKERMKPLVGKFAPVPKVLDALLNSPSKSVPRWQDENQYRDASRITDRSGSKEALRHQDGNLTSRLGRTEEYNNPFITKRGRGSRGKNVSATRAFAVRTTNKKMATKVLPVRLSPQTIEISPERVSPRKEEGFRTQAVKLLDPGQESSKEILRQSQEPSSQCIIYEDSSDSDNDIIMGSVDIRPRREVKSIFGNISKWSPKSILHNADSSDDDDKNSGSNSHYRGNQREVRLRCRQSSSSSNISRKEAENYYVVFPAPPARGVVVWPEDLNCLKPHVWLNDTIIDFWSKYIWSTTREVDQNRILIFSTYFCTLLSSETQEPNNNNNISDAERKYERARRWTKRDDIFSKDFLLIPVNNHGHWFLVVIAFPNLFSEGYSPGLEEDEEEEDEDERFENAEGMLQTRPCILVFDSLPNKRAATIKDLRQFLELEHRSRKGTRRTCNKRTMPALYVKVPDQSNGYDCGIFVLQYLQSFCETLLKDFDVPLAFLEEWFPASAIQTKRTDLLKLLASIHDEQQLTEVLKPRPGAIVGLYEDIYSP